MSGHISVMDSGHLHLSACLLFGSLLSVVISVIYVVVV